MTADGDVAVSDTVREALALVAADLGFATPRFRYESGSGVNDGYSSVLYRISIQDEDPSASREEATSVMCKTLTKAVGPVFMQSFVDEDVMYKRMLPAMEAVARLQLPLPWPRCLYTSAASPAPPVLVLEDLRPLGFRMADRSEPLDERHCRLALRQLARFHGAGMALKLKKPDTFEDLTASLGSTFKTGAFQETFKAMVDEIKQSPDILKKRFPPEVISRLKEILSELGDNFSTIMVSGSGPGYALFHGDCHINNMMFQYDKDGAVTDCKLIDFQTARFGCTAWDLSVLMLPCTDKAMRDKHWDSLLRGYHDELQATLRAAGVADPDAVYSWDQFMANMRHEFRMGLFWAPMMLHAVAGADAATAQEIRDALHEMGNSKSSEVQNEPLAEGVPPPGATAMRIKLTPELERRYGDIAQTLLDLGWLH